MATVRYLDRKLLRNIIRHTETHNRLQEEDEMWRGKAQEAFGWRDRPFSSRRRRGRKLNRERFDGQMDRLQRMNPDTRSPQDRWNWNGERNRDIYRTELGNHERWGHTGFMELYPEEFINKDSMDEMSNEEDKEDKRRKKMKRKHKRKRESQWELSSNKRHKGTESWSSSSESDISSASSDEQQVKTSAARKRTHRSQHREQSEHRRKHRRVPSIDGSASRINQHPKVKDDTSYHKRAPFRSPEKSNQRLRHSDKMEGGKKRASVDRKRERRHKDEKVNGHRSKDRIHTSPDSQKTRGVDNGQHRKRTVDGEMEHKQDQDETREKRRRKELTKASSSSRAERRDRSEEQDHSSSHRHKSSRKAKKRHQGEKDTKHARRK
ncbi:uncharacterized protein NKAPD1-like [Patiria miniata]|uniref:Uncharacterized protein n=1 Tax=Patiria miniata TaxID=46514 RepID=A0A914AH27_PATMI|nr:uncharacterized protein NKAPD1-like [Patiria miniata]XP_038062822.1 uncharacterized protein NKAPD1-like [Patiria miniata]